MPDCWTNDSYDAQAERANNTVGRAIAEARHKQRLSLAALSKRLSTHGITLQAGAIHKWERGENVPNAYQFLALCHIFCIEDVLDRFSAQPRPLELDEAGQRKLEDYKTDLIASGRYRPPRPERAEIRYRDMPVSLLSVSAGTGEFLHEENFEKISFPEDSVPYGAEFGIRVSGDSMEPVYQNGQIVWVQRCESLRPGEVGIFLYDGDGYLKVYTERDTEDGAENFTDSYGVTRRQPVLVSYNKKYDPILVGPESAFGIVGRVLN